MSDQSAGQLLVSPILRFPSEAEVGKTYLFTIDLRPQQRWPYPDEEEVTVYCLLDTAPLFSNESLGEPAVVLHRFGGSYGPARFLLTAGTEARDGVIQVTLANSRGVPLSVFETPVIQVREKVGRREESGLEVSKPRLSTETISVEGTSPLAADFAPPKQVGLKADVTSGELAAALADYENSPRESPELDLLRLLALFDGSADEGALAALRDAPAITGLTELLQGLDERRWEQTLVNLSRFTYLTVLPGQPRTLDVHPLVREHFRRQLTQTRPDAWREGNNRLYEHLKRSAKEFPGTLEEMIPLCEAVKYGCRAGAYLDAYEVYYRRVLREDQLYLQRRLGAFDLDLDTQSNFFEEPWRVPKGDLEEPYGALIQEQAGSSLRALGRLTESIQSFDAGLQRRLGLGQRTEAAFTTAHLSTSLLIAGELGRAIEFARRCDSFALQGDDRNAIQLARVIFATALLQAGRYAEAESAFARAEEIQRSLGRDFPPLDTLAFHYCDLLLSFGRYVEAQERAGRALELAVQQGWLLNIALARLLLGQTFLHEVVGYPQAADFRQAEDSLDYFNRAVEELRISGRLDYLPRGLLARAQIYRVARQFERARNDLDEAMEIATRGGMLLYEADCHLEYARLYLAQGEKEMARDCVAVSRQMSERLGYHRRDKEILEVGELLEESDAEPASEAINIFLAYSYRDEKLRGQMETHLALLKRRGVIAGWHDRLISPGNEWEGEINEHLMNADIILMLISSNFLASDYCYDVEAMRAVRRHEAGEALTIPVILRPCDWTKTPFGKLQALPKDARPVTKWGSRDAAFEDIASGILRAAQGLKAMRRDGGTAVGGPPESGRDAGARRRQTGDPPVSAHSLIPRPPVIGFVSRRDVQGRDIVARLKEELAPGRDQLLILSGPGGIGKTTLAAEAARGLQQEYGGRVVWSSADGRADFTFLSLLDDIATQLGRAELRTLAPSEKEEQVRALAASTLVVLDNYETVAEAERVRIEAWFKRTQCSALFTSRPRVPDTIFVPVTAMSREEAAEFLERLAGQTQDPGLFTPEVRERIYQTAEANPFVMQWLVGQMDLAQEPGAVLEELRHGEGDAAEHIFGRSFELPLLGEDGRDALLALSLFAPSATPGALAAVAGLGEDRKRLAEAVRNLHALWLVKGVDGNRRLAVEGLTRTLAGARLSQDPRADEFRRSFVAYFLRYAVERQEPTPENYDALEGEKDNLLGASEMAFASGDGESVTRMAYALARGDLGMLSVRGYWGEAVKLGEQALQAARSSQNEAWIASLSHNLALMYRNRGELAEARRLYDESLAIWKRLGNQGGVASSLRQLGWLAQERGELEEARRLYGESLETARRLGDQRAVAGTLHELGRLAQERGELEEARRLYGESLGIEKSLGNQRGVAITLHQSAILAQERGELEEARRLYGESLEIAKRLGDQSGVAITLHQLGRLAEDEGNKEGAARLYRESLNIFERLGSPNADIARQNLARVGDAAS